MPDFPPTEDICGAVESHIRRFFEGRSIDTLTWPDGPIREQNPHFRVLRVAPATANDVWTYASVGGWAATQEGFGLEFVICTQLAEERAVELLAMVMFYNRSGQLGEGHTLPIGEGWLPGSLCDHFLVTLPYPFGPDLQTRRIGDRHVEILWLLPISAAERNFKASRGLDALESRFEEVGLPYWKIDRDPVV